jgi:uncharacterized membrane protein
LDPEAGDLQALRTLIANLTRRVYYLEQVLQTRGASAPESNPAPSSPASVPHVPETQLPPAPSPVLPHIPAPPLPVSESHDLESRIGSHWLNRIGITAVLVGVSYFLKFAFDNNWIGASGRVAIGLIAGIAMVVWSERFRSKGYKAFSYSLKAVGIGTLYLSLWAAFQVYALIPSGVAFFAMVIVTAATGVLAVTQDAEILAAFALMGGFLTPVLVSTGQNRELELFSYVALLDLATLVLVVFRPWQRLLILSFVGTLSLYATWNASFYSTPQLRLTLGFATLFFAIFAIAPLVARHSETEIDSDSFPAQLLKGSGSPIALFLAFVNAVVYFLQVYAMYEQVDKTLSAWFALALAGVYILLSRRAGVRYGEQSQQSLRLLHLALAVGFITIAIPIRMDGHWITTGWLIEAGVLLWVADRIHSELLNAFAICALFLGVARLLIFDNFRADMLLFNERFATYLVAIAVLGAIVWYGGKRSNDAGRNAAYMATVAINVLALVALTHEVHDYFSRQMDFSLRGNIYNPEVYAQTRFLTIARDFTFSALWMTYGAALMAIGFWRRSAFVRWQALVLIAITIVKVFVYDVSELDRGFRIISFIVLGILLLAISFVYQRDWLHLSKPKRVGDAIS